LFAGSNVPVTLSQATSCAASQSSQSRCCPARPRHASRGLDIHLWRSSGMYFVFGSLRPCGAARNGNRDHSGGSKSACDHAGSLSLSWFSSFCVVKQLRRRFRPRRYCGWNPAAPARQRTNE
jgi:hypothetical protein